MAGADWKHKMAIEITHIRFSGYTKDHESITDFKWRSSTDTGTSTKAAMVTWVDDKSNSVHVGQGRTQVNVGAVHPAGRVAYLRTYADGQWSNNLLSLPNF